MEIKSPVIWEKIVNILSEKFLVFQILNYASGVSPEVSSLSATTGLQITQKKILQETNRNTLL